MKIFFQITLIFIIIQLMLVGNVFASSKVDSLLQIEREDYVQAMWNEIGKIEEQKQELTRIENHLMKTKKGQTVYLQIDTVVGAAAMVTVIISGYRVKFPPGFRAMLSAYITANAASRGVIKLSEKEVMELLNKIVMMRGQLKFAEKNLIKQRDLACKDIIYFFLCDSTY